MPGDRARIVQISDTHFSAQQGAPPMWGPTLSWLHADPPDLVVHSGDILFADPDDRDDLAFARELLADVPGDLVAIPGNHDVGFFDDEPALLDRRLEVFRRAWGADRFTRDLVGWRLVGVDVYLLGRPADDAWLHAAVTSERPVLVFVHQPLRGDRHDGWQMTDAARAAFHEATAGADVRVVASGHRHRAHVDERYVWAPSLTLSGEDYDDVGDPRLGVLEHTIDAAGGHEVRVVRPWDAA